MALEGFKTIEEKTASAEIKDSLMRFGEDVLQTKFPNLVDGMKDVVRRIVWFTRDVRELRSFNRVIGDIGEYHTSGDSSIYGALIRLAQPFMVGQPLITIAGKSGAYYDPGGAAAPRYLEARLSDFARDIFFTGVNLRTIPMVPTKTFASMEPRYLIPRLPMALVLGNLTVGFGFKSYIPMLDFGDVCDLVMRFAEHYKKHRPGMPDRALVAPYLVPSFPIRNLIKNRPELLEAYKRGEYDYPAQMEGWAEFNGNVITLRTVPYGTDFGTVTNQIREQLKDKKSWLWNHLVTVNKFNADEAELAIEVKKGQNPFAVFDKIRGLLRFTTSWKPIYSYIKNDRAVSLNPLTLTYLWYQERTISIAGGLKYRQADLVQKRMALEAMLVIAEHSDEVVDIIRNADTDEAAVDQLFHRFEQLTWKQAEIISQQKLSILAKANRKQISADLEQTDEELNTVVNSFSHIDDIVYSDAKYLKKKYATPKTTVFSDEFRGCIQFGSWGIIQFTDEEDMLNVLSSKGWPNNLVKTIHLYESRYPERYIFKHGRSWEITDNAKQIECEDYQAFPKYTGEYTIGIDPEGSTCVVEQCVQGITPGFTTWNVGREFYAVHRNGSVSVENVENYTLRKNISSGAKTDLLCALPLEMQDVLVFHMNTTDLNTLRVDKILRGEERVGKLKTVPTGTCEILAICPLDQEEVYLNIPKSCTRGGQVEYIHIVHPVRLFKDSVHLVMNTGRSNGPLRKAKRNGVVRTLFTLTL